MSKQSFANISCSIARSLDVIGERWTPLILRDLFVGMSRFEDIRRDLGIASNVLAARLHTMERHGVIDRQPYQTTPVRHEYRLTAKGLDLYPVLVALLAWGDKWISDAPPVLLLHGDCGHATAAKTVCSKCGGELNAATTTATIGPGAEPGPGTVTIGDYLGGDCGNRGRGGTD